MTMKFLWVEADTPEELAMVKAMFAGRIASEKDEEKEEERKESTKEKKEEEREGERDNTNSARGREKPEPKHRHGSFDNVYLTDRELAKLRQKFLDADEKIETFSKAKAAKGYVYKSDYAAILKWNWDDPKQMPMFTQQKPLSTYERLKQMGEI